MLYSLVGLTSGTGTTTFGYSIGASIFFGASLTSSTGFGAELHFFYSFLCLLSSFKASDTVVMIVGNNFFTSS